MDDEQEKMDRLMRILKMDAEIDAKSHHELGMLLVKKVYPLFLMDSWEGVIIDHAAKRLLLSVPYCPHCLKELEFEDDSKEFMMTCPHCSAKMIVRRSNIYHMEDLSD
ncbi:MAG TPA: hypothetical protein PKD55_02535 [Bellilinea sp.]|nr:hypothetical protein [Bellilinea sp.]